MFINELPLLNQFNEALSKPSLPELHAKVAEIKKSLSSLKDDRLGLLNIETTDANSISIDYVLNELNQILDSQSVERGKYYTERLIKSISEIKQSKINDLNLNRWKEYTTIKTDSLWIIEKRDNSGAHSGGYWGNFVPQIPQQFIARYTKKGDWILDPFLGSGTTLIECKKMGRNGIGIELLSEVAERATKSIQTETNKYETNTKVLVGDCTNYDFKSELANLGIESVQLLMMHPPYWDIIKFSQDERDLSNSKTLNIFIERLGQAVKNTYPILQKGRYLVLVIGDKYQKGEWIPL
jgi:hypothetical protein